jgi:hypothetical protein
VNEVRSRSGYTPRGFVSAVVRAAELKATTAVSEECYLPALFLLPTLGIHVSVITANHPTTHRGNKVSRRHAHSHATCGIPNGAMASEANSTLPPPNVAQALRVLYLLVWRGTLCFVAPCTVRCRVVYVVASGLMSGAGSFGTPDPTAGTDAPTTPEQLQGLQDRISAGWTVVPHESVMTLRYSVIIYVRPYSLVWHDLTPSPISHSLYCPKLHLERFSTLRVATLHDCDVLV